MHFTYEIEKRRQLSFLDVDVSRRNNVFETAVHVTTNSGDLINYKSIAPQQYKTCVKKTMLHRAYNIFSNWDNFNSEMQRLKQLFSNNNFPMEIVEKEINNFLNKKCAITEDTTIKEDQIKLYYRNQMRTQHKQEEHNVRKIISENVTARVNSTINLAIYYKNSKLSQLLIKNNIHVDNSNSHVVY